MLVPNTRNQKNRRQPMFALDTHIAAAPAIKQDTLDAVDDQEPGEGGINLLESVRIAFSTLMSNKVRTVLTALGVIIGVASVVALLAIGRGSQEQITERITANGAT